MAHINVFIAFICFSLYIKVWNTQLICFFKKKLHLCTNTCFYYINDKLLKKTNSEMIAFKYHNKGKHFCLYFWRPNILFTNSTQIKHQMFARQNTSSLLKQVCGLLGSLWFFLVGLVCFFLHLSQLSDTAKMHIVYCCFNENEL